MTDPVSGYALKQNDNGWWTYRSIRSDYPLEDGETFYQSKDDFPQEAKDWFAAQQV